MRHSTPCVTNATVHPIPNNIKPPARCFNSTSDDACEIVSLFDNNAQTIASTQLCNGHSPYQIPML